MTEQIGLTPFHRDGDMCGIVISGRWPNTTLEWTQMLVASIRIACLPGFLKTSTVFSVVDDRPESNEPELDAVGVMIALGTLWGDDIPEPGQFQTPPPALVVLHPPSETKSSLPDCDTASGCVLLPGLPELGLDHRAGWAEAEPDGTLIGLRNCVGLDPNSDPDTAVLATLLAA